jgi:hypothetical protein
VLPACWCYECFTVAFTQETSSPKNELSGDKDSYPYLYQ